MRNSRRLSGAAHDRADRLLQRLRPATGAILDHHPESAGVADTLHRRRRDNEDQGLLDGRETAIQFPHDSIGRFPRVLGALGKWCEHDENRTRIGSVGERCPGKADDVHGARNSRYFERYLDGAAIDLIRARERSTGRKLDYGYEIAAIKRRYEAYRRLAKFIEAIGQDAAISDEHQQREADHPCGEPTVAGCDRLKTKIEGAEQSMHRKLPKSRQAVLVWL